MEPLTITIGIVAGAVANALAGPKRRYKGEVTSLPGESAVPGAVGIDWSRYRLRSRAISSRTQPTYTAPYPSFRACPQGTQWDSRLNRCAPQPRAQAAPGAATQHVVIRINERQNGPVNVTIFDGQMTQAQIDKVQQYLRQNSTTSQDNRLVDLRVGDNNYRLIVTPTAVVNLRRLYGA